MSETTNPQTVTLTTRDNKKWFKATYRVDPAAGRVEYEVEGTAVAGVIVLEPIAEWPGRFYPKAYEERVSVIFGRGPIGAAAEQLTDAPVINRVQLRRGEFNFDLAEQGGRHPEDFGIRTFIRRENSSECPAATKAAAAGVVWALVDHWRALPEWPELVAAYRRRVAPVLIAGQREPMQGAATAMSAKAREIGQCAEIIDVWRDIAGPAGTGGEYFAWFGTGPADADDIEDQGEEPQTPAGAEADRSEEQAADGYDDGEEDEEDPEDVEARRDAEADWSEQDEDQQRGPCPDCVDLGFTCPDCAADRYFEQLATGPADAGDVEDQGDEQDRQEQPAAAPTDPEPLALSFALGAAHSGDAAHLAWGFAGETGRGLWCRGEQYEEVSLTIAELPGTSKFTDADVIDALTAHDVPLSRLCRQCFGPSVRLRYAARIKVTAMRAAEQLAAAS